MQTIGNREDQLKERVFQLAEEITSTWIDTGSLPSVLQMIQLTIYLEALGVLYPQRLNLCEELQDKT